MKVVFVNAGYDGHKHYTNQLIDCMKPCLRDNQYGVLNIGDINMRMPVMMASDLLVMIVPVSVGCLSSELLGFMSEVEMQIHQKKMKVNVVVYDDLPMQKRNRNAIGRLQSWCKKCGFSFYSGLGIASGGFGILTPQVKREIERLFEDEPHVSYIHQAQPMLYTYKRSLQWKKAARKNGLEVRDLYNRLNENIFKI